MHFPERKKHKAEHPFSPPTRAPPTRVEEDEQNLRVSTQRQLVDSASAGIQSEVLLRLYRLENEVAKLKESTANLKESVATLKESIAMLKTNTATLENKFAKLGNGLDRIITGVCGPMTDFALCEHAVHTHVEIDNEFHHVETRVLYSASCVASRVLENLARLELENKDIGWQGPGKGKFPAKRRHSVILDVLGGLVAFIENMETDKLKTWSPSERNPLAHDGAFLVALYMTPPESAVPDYEVARAAVKRAMQKVEESKGSFVRNYDLPEGLDNVVDALKRKGLEVKESQKQFVLKELESLVV